MHTRSLSLLGAAVAIASALSVPAAFAADQRITVKEPAVESGALLPETWYADRLARHFREVGSDIGTASSFGTDRIHIFDAVQYFSHNCFGMSATEVQECTSLFGPYADLKVIYSNGTLMRILGESGYYRSGILIPSFIDDTGTGSTVAPGSMGGGAVVPPSEPVAPEEPLSTEAEYRLRAERLWDICGNMFSDAQNACFQRNNRLVQKFGVSLDESVR